MVGIILVALGVLLAVKSIFKITSLILFDGWWAVLIFGLAIYNIVKEGANKKNTIWACVGALLFVNCRRPFLGALFGKLFVPVILVAFGIRILSKK